MNRLGSATSPYLLQHADNPVHWWQWGEDAFAEARRRDVPVLISVGYASCHWCHVMAHQSFEDEDIAAVVNELTVPIKVDREERPDVDAVYMTATQAMTGQGGWPMTVFATPDGEPFFCGTYYPRDDFGRLVEAVSAAWRDQRDAVLRQGAAVVEALAGSRLSGAGAPSGTITPALLDAAAASLLREYDPTDGGFDPLAARGEPSPGPKFPPHMAMLFLLRHHQRTGDPRALEVVRHTAEAMARGGLYDQLEGGFARYSVDNHWLVPHFEKMLYDNALLLRAYSMIWRLTGDALAGRVAGETFGFLRSGFATAEGGLASAFDADTAGEEGLTYVWTPAELIEVLGEEDGRFAADLFGVTAKGTFEKGASVLRLARDIDDVDQAVAARIASVRGRLRAARATRPQPARDDKVISSWTGLAITALVEFAATARVFAASAAGASDAGVLADAALALAARAGTLLADTHLVDGRLRRASLGGTVGEPAGVLEDHGAVAEAFCALHQATGSGHWLGLAKTVLDVALARFADGEGGFYDTADDAEKLVTRPSDPTDNAYPSGMSALVAALVSYSALAGEPSYRDVAVRALETVAPVILKHPRYAGYAAATAEALLSGPIEIAVADPSGDSPLALAALRLAPPGAVIVIGAPDAEGVPLLASRPLRDGAPTAYVCRGFVCDAPVTTVDALTATLATTR
ncbi:thioredoxin domain-containing protein [Luedemannella flava]|uniref:Thioredoxin domain-containing protein n=1 Tax=Luedemannella flava TaxID=349316 RepID=A0ABP4YQA4_9ACTN